ncbi:RNA-directed DNA polymerase [Arachis hypogaea]|nr:RNA-directed DNA polymerase [Arachis hypogaea]
MRCANLALMVKLLRQLLHSSHKLWVRVLIHKYVLHDFILETRIPNHASGISRIMNTKRVMQGRLAWSIGSLDQSFWFDSWHPNGCLDSFVPFVHITDTILKVEDV